MGRVLIVEDDAISLRFLDAALKQLKCETIGAGTIAAALAAADAQHFDLLLLDQNLPDGNGAELLALLRQRGIDCPAIAGSAEITAQARVQLRAAGFVDCFEKPVTLARLQQVLQPWLGGVAAALLDDAAALAAIGGDRDAMQALRRMLAQELHVLQGELASGKIETATLLERLHRLRASCGFCGASRLADAAAALEQALRADAGHAHAQHGYFAACCAETIVALS